MRSVHEQEGALSNLFDDQPNILVRTSVDDAKISIRNCRSIDTLTASLVYEREHMKRKSLINYISSRIRKLQKEQGIEA